MNRTITIESKNHKYQNTYGGEIYQSDFNTCYGSGKNIAERIFKDWKEYETYAKKYKQLKEYKEYLRRNYYEM